MEDFVIDLLKTRIPANYYYHNYEHTQLVMKMANEIGRGENCSLKEMELLHAAAMWHDTGYVTTYKDHEEESVALAKKHLPDFGFTADDIDKVAEIIMATKLPHSPKNKLERIIADADMAYLGSENAAMIADSLFHELQSLNPALTVAEWNLQQIAFLKKHHYFTAYCKHKYEPVKIAYLKELQKKSC